MLKKHQEEDVCLVIPSVSNHVTIKLKKTGDVEKPHIQKNILKWKNENLHGKNMKAINSFMVIFFWNIFLDLFLYSCFNMRFIDKMLFL